MREISNDNLKIKNAIQAVGYLSKNMAGKEKELIELQLKESKLEELLKASIEERNYLKHKLDSLLTMKK